jgi:hypothetical protein
VGSAGDRFPPEHVHARDIGEDIERDIGYGHPDLGAGVERAGGVDGRGMTFLVTR